MKTGAIRLYFGGLVLCLCLVFSSVAARCQPTFGGITVNSGINFDGNDVTGDSFNSADPNHSIWQNSMTYHGVSYGVYSDTLSYSSNNLPSRTSDFTLATDGSIINVGGANVFGFVDTGPGGTASLNANGSVGDLNWVSAGTAGVEPGHEEDNMNQIFYSKSLPNPASNGWQTSWLPVPASLPKNAYFRIGGTWTNISGVWTNVGGTQYQASSSGTVILPTPGATNVFVTYSMVITNMVQNTNWVLYSIGELSGNIFVDAPNVVLYCTNGISFSGSDTFSLNTNADVTIYTTGPIDVIGNAVINNGPDYARAFSIFDVAGHTNLAFSFAGHGIGSGFIYAPGSSVSFSGGGSQAYSFVGGIFCNSLSILGHYAFHYDESLGSESIPPAIIQQPVNQYVQVGSNATFSVAAGGGSTAYQWFFGQSGLGNPINGATNTSLTITNAQVSDAGFYYVEIWNTNGPVASSSAWLTVYTNAAANLSGVIYTNGQFDLLVQNFSAVGGRMPYILQASTNLTDWMPIMTNGTPFVYIETNSFPQRYYRAVFAP